MPAVVSKALFTTNEAAAFTGYSKSTLATWRSRGRANGAPVPKHIHQGGAVRYRLKDLEAFANEETPAATGVQDQRNR